MSRITFKKVLVESIRGVIEWAITPLPGPPGYALRWLYYKTILKELGWGTFIDVGVRIDNPSNVAIGRNAWIDRNVFLIGAVNDPIRQRRGRWIRRDENIEGVLRIGNETHIGPNCVLCGLAGLSIGSQIGVASGSRIYSFSHHYQSLDTGEVTAFTPRAPEEDQFMLAGPVSLEDRCGVGMNCAILPGAVLARDTFLSAGSVLGSVTEPGWVYLGQPARRRWRRDQLFEPGKKA